MQDIRLVSCRDNNLEERVSVEFAGSDQPGSIAGGPDRIGTIRAAGCCGRRRASGPAAAGIA